MVDLKLREECVQAVDFLLLFNEGVILGDTAEGEFVHEVDFVWLVHVLNGEGLDGSREGCAEKHYLAVLGVELKKLLNDRCEFGRQKLVGFIHDKHGALAEICNAFACKIEYSSRSTDNNVNGLGESDNIIS